MQYSAHGDSVDRRRHRRVAVNLLGRYMLPDRTEHPCQVRNISPGGIALLSAVCGEIGDHVIVYLDHLGRVEGEISRVFHGGFAVSLRVPERKRERLADQLTWIANRAFLGSRDDRRHDRAVPDDPVSMLGLPDGRRVACTILDMSVSGASISAPIRPEVGSTVTLGRTPGRVVRLHEEGFAVEFIGAPKLATYSGHFVPERMIA